LEQVTQQARSWKLRTINLGPPSPRPEVAETKTLGELRAFVPPRRRLVPSVCGFVETHEPFETIHPQPRRSYPPRGQDFMSIQQQRLGLAELAKLRQASAQQALCLAHLQMLRRQGFPPQRQTLSQ
jgi:hypothetical protein